MRPALVIALLAAGCTPFAEPERVAGLDGASMVTVAGERVHGFSEDLIVVDLDTGEAVNVGRAAGDTGRYDEVAVSGGWAYWLGHEPAAVPIRYVARLGGGRDRETVEFSAPAHLLGHGDCALYTRPPSLYRWCPDDEVPIEVTADGPLDDVAADDEAYYFFAADGLTRLEIATGERTLLGIDAIAGAELAIDGDQLLWWRNEQLRAIPTAGGEVVDLGTLPRTALTSSRPDKLTVDEHGYYLGAARLRRGEREGEVWIPRGGGHAAADGHMVWVEDTGVYHVPTDAAPVAPLGGEDGSIRPPFL